jgi:periplasmic protein TonB
MKVGAFGIPFISSLMIHGLVIMLGSFLVHHGSLHRQEFLPIRLIELPRPEIPAPQKKIAAPTEVKKPAPPPPPKVEKPKPPPAIAKAPIVKPEPPAPPLAAPKKEEPPKAVEAKPVEPERPLSAPTFPSEARIEGGGSEAGAGRLFENGDIGVVPGSGTAGGGGGTAASGLGRGSGAPGLPAMPLRTNREAKPIRNVRAAYPPMALRAGLESDVSLRIEVDVQGQVTKAEIIKSGGAGFDQEALKAVKQARFEPAQRDGQNVPAEFTYVYRFRLQK